MPPDFTSPRVTVRPSLPADTPAVLEFCKHIWGGHDYIPSVWHDWLADPNSRLFTAQYGAHAVGIGNLYRVADGQWWFEGFRVDPAYQDRKIGSHLQSYITTWWLEHGSGTLRLWTNARRVKVHHLSQRLGFLKTGERKAHVASPLWHTAHFTAVRAEEIPAALEHVRQSASFQRSGGLLDMGWRLSLPAATCLRDLLAWPDARLLWWRGRDGLLSTWEEASPEGRFLWIGLAATSLEKLPELLRDARALAATQYASVTWNILLNPYLADVLRQTGFQPDEENWNYQFEQNHPTRP